ncbi:hypothetical protein [Halorubrum sp. T3]|uniref:hypothetical protein n=1 Tax=Halorubrum sp. T3 TaxID=1194088 RepID=UPI0012BAAD17|nr:hypothetical protein [Halorubrum sp. T3]
MSAYNIHGLFTYVTDERYKTPHLDRSHYYFKQKQAESTPELDISLGHKFKQSSESLGHEAHKYEKIGDKFAITSMDNTVAINNECDKLYCTKQPPIEIRNIVEGLFRKRLLDEGIAMIHASAVSYNGDTYVFPAWRHTGKTNTMLSFLMEGASYLGDDRVLITKDGQIYSFPTMIHLLMYNYNSFPELLDDSQIDSVRIAISKLISTVANNINHQDISSELAHWSSLAGPDNWKRVENIFSNSRVLSKEDVSEVFFLQTSNNINEMRLDSVSSNYMSTTLKAINEYEWNQELENMWLAHDILFPERESKVDKFEKFKKREKEVISQFSSSVSTNKLEVPPEELWDQEMKSNIINKIIQNNT